MINNMFINNVKKVMASLIALSFILFLAAPSFASPALGKGTYLDNFDDNTGLSEKHSMYTDSGVLKLSKDETLYTHTWDITSFDTTGRLFDNTKINDNNITLSRYETWGNKTIAPQDMWFQASAKDTISGTNLIYAFGGMYTTWYYSSSANTCGRYHYTVLQGWHYDDTTYYCNIYGVASNKLYMYD
ncbi:MAG: hypothetical protein NT030_07505, partial [Candidatus Saganbacteria bacterium]|nr:hypothetical protein [Candidatus Saganbacteria bacterium]